MIEHQASGQTSAFNVTIMNKGCATNTSKVDKHITLLSDAVHPIAATSSGAVKALTDARQICSGLETRREIGKEGTIAPNDSK